MKKLIGKTKNAYDVYIIINHKHMLAHKDVTHALIAEAVSKVEYLPTFFMNSIDMGRIIGKDACVKTSDADDVRMVRRPGRKIKSRMVFNREPEDTNLLTVGMFTDDDGLVTVFTAYPGLRAPKELNDPRLRKEERAEAEAFWSTHALCALKS